MNPLDICGCVPHTGGMPYNNRTPSVVFDVSDVEDDHVTVTVPSYLTVYSGDGIVLIDRESGDTYIGDVQDTDDDWAWVSLR